jgi:hypothetical protein
MPSFFLVRMERGREKRERERERERQMRELLG